MAQLKRDYEVSVWTLQDEFLSILKASNIENKGQIEKPDFHLIDDGTEEFTFSIPMYLYSGKKRIINPLWNDTKNGIILQDLRKIKLTFNKNTADKKTFEFIITEINEKHESDKLYCDIKCGGLAFHELGKKGYKISMTADDFNDEDYRFFIGEISVQPHATLQYWMNKIMPYVPSDENSVDAAQWYYKIDMDWGSSAGIRLKNKVYEDPYVKSWTIKNGKYIPTLIEETKEKERLPDINESNLYNITQDLAELFGVFCRYEYEHNDNLNITKRVVVFYNSYMREKEGYIDLTYPYSTSAITRSRDSNELSTKMFVKAVDDQDSLNGQITIMNVEANKLHEDYLLNFEYLYKIGNITKDQYEQISKFEIKIGELNRQLQLIEGPLMALYNQLPNLNAQVTFLTNAVQLDTEKIGDCNDLLNQLTDGSGELTISSDNPRTAVLVKSSKTDAENSYHINLTDKGILPETVKLYYTYDFTSKQLKDEIDSGTPEYDEFNNLIRISSIFKNDSMKNTIYLTYKYIPQLCYENVKKVWEERLNKDTIDLQKAKNKVQLVESRIKILEEEYETIQKEKSEVCKNFEKLLGPALRESYWQPEDYKDSGNSYIDNFTIMTVASYAKQGESSLTKFLWDTKPFDDELEKTGYKTGINQNWCGYPVIDLSGHEEYLTQNCNNLSFMFYDFKHVEDLNDPTAKTPRNMRIFTVGSTAQYGFVNVNGDIKPVLIITGFEKLADDSRKRLSDQKYSPTVGVIDTKINGASISTYIHQESWTPVFLNEDVPGQFLPMQLYYPRIKINSLSLKIDSMLLNVKYNNQLLNIYEDYDVLMRDNSNWQEDNLILSDSAYYIILKPNTLLSQGSLSGEINFKFNISNADIAIYLDAQKVLEENSQPKVSYTIEPSVFDEEFLYTLYNKLCRICNINDYELKFDNVQGYISEITINCDDPSEDSIEIKNYKTKFEDLFSSIVAQTEAMKKSAFAIDIVSDTFGRDGSIAGETLQQSVDGANLQLSFNNDNLTITNENGILGISDSGAVVFRNDGIFTAFEKDSNDNWKWNSAILPSGINANLITAGQLDTNRIKIYSGDKIRFQLNGDGIFAYKSFFEDLENYKLSKNELQKINSSPARIDDIDSAQYVVMNENGLFLWGKKNALILNKEGSRAKYTKLEKDVARVEVSWDGFKLRNWNNDEVFYADPDTGNLHITGAINATSLFIDGNNGNKMSLDSTTGNIVLNGSKILIEGQDVDIQAKQNINIKGTGALNLSGSSLKIEGGSIKMITTEIDENNQINLRDNMSLSSDGIKLYAGNGLVLIIEKDLIHFQQTNEDDPNNNGEITKKELFSVDNEGTLYCRRLMCDGEMTGVIPDTSEQGQAGDTYLLKYNSTDKKEVRHVLKIVSSPYIIDREIALWTAGAIEASNYNIDYYIYFKITTGIITPKKIQLNYIDNNNNESIIFVQNILSGDTYDATKNSIFGIKITNQQLQLMNSIPKGTSNYKLILEYDSTSQNTITQLAMGKRTIGGETIDSPIQLKFTKINN